jgi:exodeoxyribonuclease V alpha subunit
MDERFQRLGVTTVWLRRQAAVGAEERGGEFRRRLRQIETGAAELNLDAAMVHLAAEIAALEAGLDDERRLALILLITASLAASQEGSTRLPVVGPQAREPMARILRALCGDAFGANGPDAMVHAIGELLDGGAAPHVIGRDRDDHRPLIYLTPCVYQHRVLLSEHRLAQLLASRITDASPGVAEKILGAALADTFNRPSEVDGRKMTLSDEQRRAVANACAHRLALISGGPGTGKTTIILTIARVLTRIGVGPGQIALAAPTGKAAFRMGESINEGLARIINPAQSDLVLKAACPEPATIHRLLGYSPSRRRFNYHRNNPLDPVVVIVDEGSMLDLTLMERLAGAIKPGAQLIVLGDADQLPSVAAGAVFRDLASALPQAAPAYGRAAALCTRLTQNYRMDTSDPAGRAVFSMARAINSADCGAAGTLARFDRPEQLRFEGVELLAAAGLIEPLLDRWFQARIKSDEIERLNAQVFTLDGNGFDSAARAGLERIFNHLAASRILCLTRVFATGSERVNASLHRRAADAQSRAPEREFLPGEPVIVTRNDYERMLFNGDQGVIVRVRRPDRRASAMAVFKRAGRFDAFHLAGLREQLELCYATTIHKAQGSEFDAVAIVMPERDLPILTREALYTGVTRSRRSVVIAGSEELLRTAIARGIERFSGLGEELTRMLHTNAA